MFCVCVCVWHCVHACVIKMHFGHLLIFLMLIFMCSFNLDFPFHSEACFSMKIQSKIQIFSFTSIDNHQIGCIRTSILMSELNIILSSENKMTKT